MPRKAPSWSVARAVLCVLAAALALVATSCGDDGTLIVFDPFFRQTVSSDDTYDRWERAIEREVKTEVAIVETDGEIPSGEAVISRIEAYGGSLVVLGPLFVREVERVAERFPEVGIVSIALTVPERKFSSERVLVVVFDRIEAFKEAGRKAASLLADRSAERSGASPGGGGAEPSGLPERVAGAVFLTDTDERREEMAAFREGFLESEELDRLVIREIGSRSRQDELRSVIQDLQGPEVEVVAIFAGPLSPAAIERFSDSRLLIVTENQRSSGAFPDRVVFTIEENMEKAITEGIRRFRSGERGVVEVNADLERVTSETSEDS